MGHAHAPRWREKAGDLSDFALQLAAGDGELGRSGPYLLSSCPYPENARSQSMGVLLSALEQARFLAGAASCLGGDSETTGPCRRRQPRRSAPSAHLS